MMKEVIALFNDVWFSYGNAGVLKGVSFELNKGDFAILSGANGSGKSTLIKILLGELKVDRGTIHCNKEKISYMPQITGRGNITFPVNGIEICLSALSHEMGFISLPKRNHKKRALELLRKMGVENLSKRSFTILSGGQKQRVLLAAALCGNPSFLVLDEPSAGMDEESRKSFIKLLKKLTVEEELTVLMVTHEASEVKEYANKLLYLKEGKINNVTV